MQYNIKIYSDDGGVLTRQRNNFFDDIDGYLSAYSVVLYEADSIQLQQIDFNKVLRLDMPERNANANYTKFSYIVLTALDKISLRPGLQTIGKYYYFVDDVKRKGSQTVEFSLTLDTLQTFQNEIFKSLSPRTRIHREHVDRFLGKDKRTALNLLPWATIDRYSEGLNPPLYRLSRGSEVLPSANMQTAGAWFLVYQTTADITADTRQPVAAYLMPENSINVSSANALPSGYHLETFDTTETASGKDYQYILLDQKDGNEGAYFSVAPSFKIGGTYQGGEIRALQLDTSKKIYALLNYESSSVGDRQKLLLVYSGSVETNAKVTNGVMVRNPKKSLTISDFVGHPGPFYEYDAVYLKSAADVFSLAPFSSLKRTDTRLMKIIKLPYFPLTAKYDASGNLLLNNVTIEDGKIRVNDFEEDFFNENIKDEGNYVKARKAFVSEINNNLAISVGGREKMQWDAVEDPKLYASEFYQEKLQYDSFAYLYKLEDFDITDPAKQLDSSYRANCEISYKQSAIMASRMVFWFDWGALAKKQNSDFQPRTNQDYGEFLFIERSNEMPIYSNAYIDYINNGYNYDRKNLDEQKSSRWVNFGASLVTAATQGAIGLATGNAFSTAKAVGEVGGVFSTVYNNLMTQASAERGLQQKQDDLKRQASSVSACDDMGLFELYGRNLLLSFRYQASKEILENIKKLFHYYGYSSARTGKPNTDNRYWFNFIQCTPDFVTPEGTSVKYLSYADDISARLEEGATLYHVHRDDDGNAFANTAQDLLNIETDYAGLD